MSAANHSSGGRRFFFTTLLALVVPILCTQCKSVGGGNFRDVKYDPATLGTPAGHGLEKHEYPFDDQGKYRKDWVQNNASGRTRTSYPGERTAPAVSSTTGSDDRETTSDYPNYADLTSSNGTGSVASPPEPAGSSPQYHKVSTGDTLFALAARYNTSVDDLKRVNGLSGDSIRVGQSLRIP